MHKALRLLLVAVVAVASLASVAASAPSQGGVTLRVDRTYDANFGRDRFQFSGSIPSRTAGEYVTVMALRCGQKFATAIAGGTTHADGTWEDTWDGFATGGTATYRARWKGEVSPPVTVRGELQLFFSRRSRSRFTIGFAADSNMLGRFVRLERLAAGRWTLVRRARLEHGGGTGTSYGATFVVRERRLTLRIVVPRATAAPCYPPAVTPTFRS